MAIRIKWGFCNQRRGYGTGLAGRVDQAKSANTTRTVVFTKGFNHRNRENYKKHRRNTKL